MLCSCIFKVPSANLLGVLVKSAEYQAPCPDLLGAGRGDGGEGLRFYYLDHMWISVHRKCGNSKQQIFSTFHIAFAEAASSDLGSFFCGVGGTVHMGGCWPPALPLNLGGASD